MMPTVNSEISTSPLRNGIFLIEFVHSNCHRYNHESGCLESCWGFDAVNLYDSGNWNNKTKASSDEKGNPHLHPQQHHHHRNSKSGGSKGGGTMFKADEITKKQLYVPSAITTLLQGAAEWHFCQYHTERAFQTHTVELQQAKVVWKDLRAGAMDLLDAPPFMAQWQIDLVRTRGYVDHIRIAYSTPERVAPSHTEELKK